MGWIDKVLNWTISKKLSVIVVATVLVSGGKLEGSEWVNIAMIYIGGQTIIDAIIRLRNK